MMPKYDGERLLIISMPSILEFQDLIVLLGISLSTPMSFQVLMHFQIFLNYSVVIQVFEFNTNQMAFSDEFELEFSELSRARVFQFSSWNRAIIL